jgi:hypothetical protein
MSLGWPDLPELSQSVLMQPFADKKAKVRFDLVFTGFSGL